MIILSRAIRMNDSFCCLRLINGVFYRVYLSRAELGALNDAEQATMKTTRYMYYSIDKGLFIAIIQRKGDQKFESFEVAELGLRNYIRSGIYSKRTRDLIIFKMGNTRNGELNEYVSLGPLDDVVFVITGRASTDVREWNLCAYNESKCEIAT